MKKLNIIPLGGAEEIGKNIMAIEYGDDMIVVDCGMAFPEVEMLGIDLVIPDFSFLIANKEKIRAVLITHGHEDHIGALPYLLRQIDVPVYGTAFTLALIETKLIEHGIENAKLKKIKPRDTRKFGCFEVEFIRTTHSTLDTVGLAIRTPIGIIVHTSDFKVDYTPVGGEPIDLNRFAALGEEGVLLMMADSTNAERPGYTMSERTIGESLDALFQETKGRIIISTFSSNIHRIQQICDSARAYNRKVSFTGRSMLRIVGVAQELGLLRIKEDMLVGINRLDGVADRKLVIITTGSQGEPMSGLVRMASREHAQVQIREGDTVIISALPIPGNEKFVYRVINQLFRCGANVIYGALADVHVSGHACQEELKLMHSLVKPKYFVPVHGEYRHLLLHAKLAESMGMSPKNILLPQNGRIIQLTKNRISEGGEVHSGGVMVDGLGIGDVGDIVLRDRKHLSEDGLMIVILTISRDSGKLLAEPDVISRGFVYVRASEELMDEARKVVKDTISSLASRPTPDWTTVKSDVKTALNKFLYERTKRRPMILPVVVEI
ncbi:MAG: ribonuclease J [Clostridiales bacterium]|nr:ribonuclease J [Clostridiales bacterium]